MNRRSKLAAALALVLILPACVNQAQTESAKRRYEAIAPEYGRLIEEHPHLSAEEKARRMRTLDTWRLELDKAGEAVPDWRTLPTPALDAPEEDGR